MNNKQEERLSLLSKDNNHTKSIKSSSYTKIVKALRIILPVAALALAIIVLTWGDVDKTIQTAQIEEDKKPQIGTNELIDPKFESRDKNNKPFTITAKKAISGEKNPDLIQMEEPLADMTLKDNSWIAIKGNEGRYWQKDQKLELYGNVNIFHDKGYEIISEEFIIDFKKGKLFTSKKIGGHGPAGTIQAQSMSADSNTGNLIFNGPAKLVLYNAITLPQPQ